MMGTIKANLIYATEHLYYKDTTAYDTSPYDWQHRRMVITVKFGKDAFCHRPFPTLFADYALWSGRTRWKDYPRWQSITNLLFALTKLKQISQRAHDVK